MRFTAQIEQSGATATGIEVPAEVVDALGVGRRPKVTVTINGQSYRSSIASMGGRFMVGVSAENRALTRVAGGDVVEVDVELDAAPRVVDVPTDLAEALANDAEARATWDRLSYSHQLQHALAIADAKRPETRQRRIAKALEMLREMGT